MEMMNINNIEITRDQAKDIAILLRELRPTADSGRAGMIDTLLEFLDRAVSAPEFEEVDGIPTWAIYYLEYGEDDDLTDTEIEEIRDFLEENHYRFSSEKDPDDYSFDWHPQFGKPCNTCTCIFEIVKDKENESHEHQAT